MARHSANVITLTLFITLVVLTRYDDLQASTQINVIAIHAIGVLQQRTESQGIEETENNIDSCHQNWLRGRIAFHNAGLIEAQDYWQDSLACSDLHLVFVRYFAPDSYEMAYLSTQLQPDSAEAWFWLANVIVEKDKVQSIAYYRTGLKLNPADGLRWRELGDLLRVDDPNAAIEAYLQSCYNGDPGANGCYLAGQTAEAMGEYEAALRYYRLSDWSGSHDRANILEARWQTGELP